VQILLTKTIDHDQKNTNDRARRSASLPNANSKGPLSWKPQASTLTRDETRDLVLEMIG
jgi:hypothetical protein